MAKENNKQIECFNCKKKINYLESNNGMPLFNGRVCDKCNLLVVADRFGV